jgi:hypothetical protein
MSISPSQVSTSTPPSTDIPGQIVTLKEFKRKFISEKRFLEANQINIRIKELKAELLSQQQHQMSLKHKVEKLNIDKVIRSEEDKEDEKWNAKLVVFAEENKAKVQELEKQHAQKLQEYLASLQEALPKKYKPSPKLISMRQHRDIAIKTEEFCYAQELEEKVAELEKQEEEAFFKKRDKKIELEAAHYKAKLEDEMKVLVTKIRREYEVLVKRKEESKDFVNTKHQTIQRKLERNQRDQRVDIKKKAIVLNQLKSNSSTKISSRLASRNSSTASFSGSISTRHFLGINMQK